MHSTLLTISLDVVNESNSSEGELNEQDEHEQDLKQLQWIAYGVIAPLLIGVGIIGNLLNLVVLTRPNLKSVTYTYLTWLAISDLMSLIFTIPTLLRFVGHNLSDYYSLFFHAHFELALVNAFMACSVFIVVAVTVERYFSVSKPTKFKNIHTPGHARVWIITSYVASFLLYIPVCFFKTVQTEVDPSTGKIRYVVKENFSVSHTSMWTAYLYIKESVVRLGPTVVLTFLNIMIIVAFQRVVRKRKALFTTSRMGYVTSGSPGTRLGCEVGQKEAVSANFQEERRLVMLLIAVVVMFVITMTPAAFLTLFMSNEKERSYSFQAFRAFANNMEFVNYAMNFYLYCLCSTEIRETFLQMFHFITSKSFVRGKSNIQVLATRNQLEIENAIDEQPTTTCIDIKI